MERAQQTNEHDFWAVEAKLSPSDINIHHYNPSIV
jgi:hypothetical protein